MKLLKIEIDNFGVLHDYKQTLDSGLNTLCQHNGWGKSTLAVFLKAMLYGLPATAKQSLDENERKKYLPWNGGKCGGSLEFETDRGRFRAERTFAAKKAGDTFALYDLATNRPSTAYPDAPLGEALFGIDEDGFERSTYLSQRTLSPRCENNSIRGKLANVLEDVNDIGSYDDAIEALDRRRKYYILSGNRGKIAETEDAIRTTKAELEKCVQTKAELDRQKAQLTEINRKISETQTELDSLQEKIKRKIAAREHDVLRRQKDGILKELADLEHKKQENAAFFRGRIPTAEEHKESGESFEQLKVLRTQYNAIPVATPEEEATLQRLTALYPAGAPRTETLDALETEIDRLQTAVARRDALRGTCAEAETLSGRFPSGLPSQPELDEAYEKLHTGINLRAKLDNAPQPPAQPRGKGLLPTGLLLSLLGAALVACGLFPYLPASSGAVPSYAIPFALGGAVLAGIGIFLILLSHRNAASRKAFFQIQAERKSMEKQASDAFDAVRVLISAYGISNTDPEAGLTELLQQVKAYRVQVKENAYRRQKLEAAIAEVSASLRSLYARLSEWTAQPMPDTPEGFPPLLRSLRQDADTLTRLQREELRRAEGRKALSSRMDDYKRSLYPYLLRYDPEKKLNAAECLEAIREHLDYDRQLSQEIANKEASLQQFLSEHNPDALPTADTSESYEDMEQNETVLKESLRTLSKEYTALSANVDRLSAIADRIPDLEQSLSRNEAELSVQRDNACTVQNASKFLTEAKESLSTRYLQGMQESFRRYFNEFCSEIGSSATLNSSLEVLTRDGGQSHPLESLSRGLRDIALFCVRLSLTDALFEDGEQPFLLLDDPFTNLDDERLVVAKKLVASLSSRFQIIHLVCSRERV